MQPPHVQGSCKGNRKHQQEWCSDSTELAPFFFVLLRHGSVYSRTQYVSQASDECEVTALPVPASQASVIHQVQGLAPRASSLPVSITSCLLLFFLETRSKLPKSLNQLSSTGVNLCFSCLNIWNSWAYRDTPQCPALGGISKAKTQHHLCSFLSMSK